MHVQVILIYRGMAIPGAGEGIKHLFSITDWTQLGKTEVDFILKFMAENMNFEAYILRYVTFIRLGWQLQNKHFSLSGLGLEFTLRLRATTIFRIMCSSQCFIQAIRDCRPLWSKILSKYA